MDFIFEILICFSIGFAGLRLLVTIYNLFTYPVLESRVRENSSPLSFDLPFLSILIPARNEEQYISNVIQSLQKQSYKNYELIILDDNSTDETANIISEYSKFNTKIKLVQGKPLPEGWLGKNWACHQLSQIADGEFMLFLDADVTIEGNAIYKALTLVSQERLTLLSLFPEQKIISLGEKLTVPIMHYLLLSLLPLDFVFYFQAPSLSAANGQFMFFNSEHYRKERFHERCKAEIVEDIKIMQILKAEGLKGRTLLGNKLAYCRMYHTYIEGVNGFSKNLLSGFGSSKIGLSIFMLIVVFIPAYSIFKAPDLAFIYFCIALLIRICISIVSRQSVIENIIFHHAHIMTFVILSFKSIKNSYTKSLEWKGRKLG